MSETISEEIKTRIYVDLREEASKFGEDQTLLDKNSLLYKFVEKQAKELGLDMEKEGIKVEVIRGSKTGPGYMDYENKILGLDIDLLNKIAGANKIIESDSNSLDILGGIIKHELQHYKDEKKGYFLELNNNRRASDGEYKKGIKIGECRADSVTQDNEGFKNFYRSLADLEKSGDSYDTHPLSGDRVKALVIQSYIKKETGIELKLEDIKFNDKCEFSITNKEKLHSIPAEVLVEAYQKAENKSDVYTDLVSRWGFIESPSIPSVPHKPKTQQDKNITGAGH